MAIPSNSTIFCPPKKQVYHHQNDSPGAYVAKLDNEGIRCCCWTPVLFNRMEMEIVGWRNQSEGIKKIAWKPYGHFFFTIRTIRFITCFPKYGHQNHIRAIMSICFLL